MVSKRITSAPSCASVSPPSGAATNADPSTTRRPENGAMAANLTSAPTRRARTRVVNCAATGPHRRRRRTADEGDDGGRARGSAGGRGGRVGRASGARSRQQAIAEGRTVVVGGAAVRRARRAGRRDGRRHRGAGRHLRAPTTAPTSPTPPGVSWARSTSCSTRPPARRCKRLTDMTTEDWQRVMATNVIGVQHVITATAARCSRRARSSAVLSSETIGQPRAGLGRLRREQGSARGVAARMAHRAPRRALLVHRGGLDGADRVRDRLRDGAAHRADGRLGAARPGPGAVHGHRRARRSRS